MLRTLQARLLAWLLIPLLFMSSAHLASTYLDTHKTSQEIFDKLLLTLALSISEHALASGGDLLTDDLLELIRTTTKDNLYYKVIGPDNSFIMGYEDIPEPPGGLNFLESNLEFYETNYWDDEVRVISVSRLIDNGEYSGWMTTFVAQTKNDRDAYVNEAMVDNAVRVSIAIVVTSILLSLGVLLGLRPLRRLSENLRKRDPGDITELDMERSPEEIHGVVNELNNLFGRLAEQMSLTKRFVENAAHQLRTPVTALLPQTELALRYAESDDQKTRVYKIKDSANRIARLTNQLLNLTHAESIAHSKLEFSRFNLEKICLRQSRVFGEQFSNSIVMNLQPAPVQGAEMMLEEVLENLLDNARKYGNDGGDIQLATFVLEDRLGVKYSVLEVCNDGRPIAEDHISRITERFYRLSKDQTGTGLGLAIAREVLVAHRGRIEISANTNGSGCRVRCILPFD